MRTPNDGERNDLKLVHGLNLRYRLIRYYYAPLCASMRRLCACYALIRVQPCAAV
jgi:hypothetical protein